MISLKEWEEKRRHERAHANDPRPNGIACPTPGCGGELWDSTPGVVLLSSPPQKQVHCPKCGIRMNVIR